jgi:hypothetical protein
VLAGAGLPGNLSHFAVGGLAWVLQDASSG